jgi:phenylacetate-coenzyme A ligase PaaK-like adenylate-forming protein
MLTPLEPWIGRKIGLKKGASLTRQALEEYRLCRLRETVALARRESPFYRGHLAGVSDGAPRSLADFHRLPFTFPADIQKDDLRFLCVSRDEVERVVTLCSSGTMAQPKRLHFTADDLELTTDFFHHGMATMVQPGDRVLILMPGELPGSVGDLLVKGLARLNVVGIVHGLVRDPAKTLQIVAEHKINCLVGLPVQLLALARHSHADVIPPGQLRSILLSADYVPRAIVRELTARWGAGVFNHYGMTETGLGGGVECGHRCGYHLREADLFYEIVDPASGEPLPAGELGEVVVTTLTRQGMPLIRYRSGDLARYLPEPCPCGTLLLRLERISGRIANGVFLNGGGLLTMAALDEALFPLPFLLNFQPVLSSIHGVDRLDFTIETVSEPGKEVSIPFLQALLGIPAIASACAQKRLLVGTIEPGVLTLSGSIKRTIIDRREVQPC